MLALLLHMRFRPFAIASDNAVETASLAMLTGELLMARAIAELKSIPLAVLAAMTFTAEYSESVDQPIALFLLLVSMSLWTLASTQRFRSSLRGSRS